MNSEFSPEERIDLLSLRSNKLSPEHFRRKDSQKKQFRRTSTRSEKESAIRLRVDSIKPQLVSARRSKMAEWLEWQFALDPFSYDLSNGLRAADLLLAGQESTAEAIMAGIVGYHEPEKQDAPIRHIPFTETGGVDVSKLGISPEITKEFDRQLLKNIGSGR